MQPATAQNLAQRRRRTRPGAARRLHGRQRLARHVVPRDARRPERGARPRRARTPIAFDSDCREGICGTCSLVVNGVPHGPDRGTTVCQLHMRRFKDGDTDHHRAVAREGLPRRQGSGRRSQRLRPHHRGGRLRVGQRRRRAGRATAS